MILSNAGIEYWQQITALAAIAPNGTLFTDQSFRDHFLESVTYRQVVSVVKQCEKTETNTSNKRLSANSTATLCNSRHGRSSGFCRPSNAALNGHPFHT